MMKFIDILCIVIVVLTTIVAGTALLCMIVEGAMASPLTAGILLGLAIFVAASIRLCIVGDRYLD